MTEQPFTPGIAVEIGAAATATRTQLDILLERASISFDAWVSLATIWNATLANAGPPVSSGELLSGLGARLGGNDGAADDAISELASAGLLCDIGEAPPPGLRLTAAGEATFRGIRDTIARLTRFELDGITDGDLETTRRVLRLIAERARAFAA